MTVKLYGRRTGLLGAALQTLPGKLASHWLVQGMAYMDRTERVVKLGLDGTMAVALLPPLLGLGLAWPAALGGAAVVAHSLNFLFNGHLRGALKWHGLGGVPRAAVEEELVRIAQRLTANRAIAGAFVYGSLARGELHDGSDLDIRVIRAPGPRAALAACLAVAAERSRSLVSGVPLDIYVWDSIDHLERMRADERPISLRDVADLGVAAWANQ